MGLFARKKKNNIKLHKNNATSGLLLMHFFIFICLTKQEKTLWSFNRFKSGWEPVVIGTIY